MLRAVFTLCLGLLPATAWAAGETVPSNVTLAGTALESGKSYIATVDGITEKTGESAETNYLTYDNGTLIVIGTVEITCDSAGLSFYNGTLTLAGNGDLTIAASGSNSAVSGSPQSTLTTAEGFSGSITLGSVNASAVQNVVLDLTTGGDILISSAKNSAVNTPQNPVMLAGKTVTIKGTDETTEASPANVSTVTAPKLNVTAGDGVTITGSGAIPLIADDNGGECAVTLNAGGDVEIVNKGGMAVFGPLTVTEAHNVTIGGGGTSLLYSANGVHCINASGTVKMESSGIVCSGNDANGLTITGAETVDIAGESTSAPVVTGMTLNECGAATVTRLQCSDTMAPIASTGVTSDIPVLLRNGSNDIEPQLLWDGEYYQKAAVDDVYMEPSSEAAVYYEAGDGYVMFSKTSDGTKTGTANAVLLNAGSTAPIAGNLAEVKVIGENSLSEIQSLDEVGTKVSFTGNGTLHTFFGGSVEPEIADSVAFHGLVCVMTTEAPQEQEKPRFAVA